MSRTKSPLRRRARRAGNDELQMRILEKFVTFPGVTNSAEDIARSWLGGEDSGRVSNALTHLLDTGMIGRLGWGDSETYFAIDPHNALKHFKRAN